LFSIQEELRSAIEIMEILLRKLLKCLQSNLEQYGFVVRVGYNTNYLNRTYFEAHRAFQNLHQSKRTQYVKKRQNVGV